MRTQTETTLLKLTEKFDKELLRILSKEIKATKSSKFLVTLKENSNNSLLVA